MTAQLQTELDFLGWTRMDCDGFSLYRSPDVTLRIIVRADDGWLLQRWTGNGYTYVTAGIGDDMLRYAAFGAQARPAPSKPAPRWVVGLCFAVPLAAIVAVLGWVRW